MEPVVETRGLAKAYGDVRALDGVDLAVQPGEIFALIGPNGAGKTTLVRVLTGTLDPDAGEVTLFGESPGRVDRERIGLLPQAFGPPERLTPRELFGAYAGLYGSAREPERLLEEVGLQEAADTWYERLSGGQQRRACLGTALVNDPEVLFLDEPTTGIDPAGRRTVHREIRALAEAGTTVFLTTHDMAEAEALADRVGLIADGRLVATGAPRELIREHGGEPSVSIELEPEGRTGLAPSPAGSKPDTPQVDDSAGGPRGDSTDGPPGDATDGPADDPTDGPAGDSTVGRTVAALHERGFRATADDGTLTISGIQPESISPVIATLEEAELGYRSLSWAEPDLEDVYLALAEQVEDRVTGSEPDEGSLASAVESGGERP